MQLSILRARHPGPIDRLLYSEKTRRIIIFLYWILVATVPTVLVAMSQSDYLQENYGEALLLLRAGMGFQASFYLLYIIILIYYFLDFLTAMQSRLKVEQRRNELNLLKFQLNKVCFFVCFVLFCLLVCGLLANPPMF